MLRRSWCNTLLQEQSDVEICEENSPAIELPWYDPEKQKAFKRTSNGEETAISVVAGPHRFALACFMSGPPEPIPGVTNASLQIGGGGGGGNGGGGGGNGGGGGGQWTPRRRLRAKTKAPLALCLYQQNPSISFGHVVLDLGSSTNGAHPFPTISE